MNAQQQSAYPQELEEYEDYEDDQTEERHQWHVRLVDAQDAYWSWIVELNARGKSLSGFGEHIVSVENLCLEAVAHLPDAAEWSAAIQARDEWATEVTRLQTLLELKAPCDQQAGSNIVCLWP